MRILIVNPNTSEAVTDLLIAAGETVALPGTTLVPLTAPRGFPYISTRSEAQIGGALALEMIAAYREGADAAIIAAFGDPGLAAARELFDIPVVGMAEAAMLTALMLGRRFAIVTFAAPLADWYGDCVALYGLAGRCAAIRALAEDFSALSSVQAEKEDALLDLATRTVREDGADCVILGGAPLAGLAAKARGRCPVPVVDPISAAVKQAETLVTLALPKATAGSGARPAAKPNAGLADALGTHMRGES